MDLEEQESHQRGKQLLANAVQVNDLVKAKDKNMIAKNKLFVLPNFDDEIEML